MTLLKGFALLVMLIAFIFNFLGPKLLKDRKGESLTIREVNSIKISAFLVVLACSVFIFI